MDSGKSISPMTSVDSSLSARKRVRYVLPQGCLIGGIYEIVKPLGHGGMGEVYLARHTKLDIYRAIKILLPKIAASNSIFTTRFMREARLAIQLEHPNIINVMDANRDEELSIYYIVMEYVDGGTVRNLIRRNGAFAEKEALKIILCVARALEAAEKHKIVHRDIKPDNIMLTKDNMVKLADLGIAKSTGDHSEVGSPVTEALIGTPAYVAPEQARNAQEVDCRADIYSLGVTLYEMLAAEKPYKGKSSCEILKQIFESPVPDIRKKNPLVSDAVAELIFESMAKDRNDRPRNWTVFCKKVSAILNESEPAVNDASCERVAEGSMAGGKQAPSSEIASNWKKILRYGIPSLFGFGFCMLLMSGLLSPGTLTKWEEEFTLAVIPEKYRTECEKYHLRPPLNFILMKDVQKEVWINQNKPQKAPPPAPITVRSKSDDGDETPNTDEYKGRGALSFESDSSPEIENWLKRKQYELEVSSKRIGKMSIALPGTLEVPAGRYRLKMSLPECKAFPEIPVDLKRDEKQKIRVRVVPLDATVKIKCNIPEFEVWWSDEWLKSRELKIEALRNFDLVLRAPGYKTHTTTLKLQPGESRNVHVALERLQNGRRHDTRKMADADAAYEKKNYATAKKLYLEEAEQGNPLANYRLGEIYEHGYGEWFANKEKAYRHYRMAADQDVAAAMYKVGEFHEKGLGNVVRNEKEALNWYRRGAELEHIGCLNKIGRFYENGRGGLERAPERAVVYYLRGASRDNAESQYFLGRLYEGRMLAEPSERKRESFRRQARHWYEEAARKGYLDARDKIRAL